MIKVPCPRGTSTCNAHSHLILRQGRAKIRGTLSLRKAPQHAEGDTGKPLPGGEFAKSPCMFGTISFLIISLFIFGEPGFAQTEDLLPYRQQLQAQAQYLATLPKDESTAGCRQRYARLWRDQTLQVDWFYGYMDADEVVADRLVRQETTRALLQPCQAGLRGACGFTTLSDQSKDWGPITLRKNLGSGRRVDIRIWNSTVSDWDQENNRLLGLVMTSEQEAKRETLWTAFVSSIRTSEVVIYDGHSRNGSGPGFGPYHILQMVAGALFKYNWYKVTGALAHSETKPELMMFASCESQKYYSPDLRRFAPAMAVAANKYQSTFGAAQQMPFSLIDSLVVGRCEKGLNLALHSTNGPEDGGMKIWGFD